MGRVILVSRNDARCDDDVCSFFACDVIQISRHSYFFLHERLEIAWKEEEGFFEMTTIGLVWGWDGWVGGPPHNY